MFMMTGHDLLEKDEYEDARGCYSFSLEVYPDNTEARSALAFAELRVIVPFHHASACSNVFCRSFLPNNKNAMPSPVMERRTHLLIARAWFWTDCIVGICCHIPGAGPCCAVQTVKITTDCHY